MLKTTGESIMPADALLMSTIVVAIFVTFAGALVWADRQTSAGRPESDVKRRSF
jgi:cell division protein FtsN